MPAIWFWYRNGLYQSEAFNQTGTAPELVGLTGFVRTSPVLITLSSPVVAKQAIFRHHYLMADLYG